VKITEVKKIIFSQDNEKATFEETLKESFKHRRNYPGVEIWLDWNDIQIPIKPRSTILGCINYYMARDERLFPRKYTTHKVLK
jgi:hypothetical protein